MNKTTEKKFTCRKCNHTFIPSFMLDFYPDGKDPEVGLCERCMMAEAFAKSFTGPTPISEEHSVSVCKRGKGSETCSFLVFGKELCCAKGSNLEPTLRKRIAEKTISSLGDNCSGPPEFKPN